MNTTAADARINQLPPDPVGHLRSNIKTRIDSASEETIRMIVRVFNTIDPNLRKPLPPAGWRPIRSLASELQIDPGHLARQCRDLYAAHTLARLCTIAGRQTWCLSPACADQLRATHAPHNPALVPGSGSVPSLVSRATHSPSGVITDSEPAPKSAALSERNTDLPSPAAPLAEVTP